MTDNEIKKAFMICNNLEDGYCSDCPFEYCDRCIRQVAINTLDLINRYEAEKEALISGQETLQKYIATLQEENERLTHITRNLIGEIKAEAYTEFAEEMFELFPADKSVTYISRVTIKNILNEKVGSNEKP